MRRLRCEEGFTLIELVVVIVVLGILGVIAVPKYLDIRAQAEEGVANGVTAALRGAVAIRHARYLMDNAQTYDRTTIAGDIEAEDVTIGATNAGIQATFASANTYTWTYTARSGTTPAKVTKSW
ncbi:MAG: prepilin-type N-terminal cleavage/methylation domain-containing protein [Desulfobacteraceae bacterium]|nr:prepilin-type N-terminal cleavage/methylation domain-containing protein [Desulfobacteraceae bacterium]